MMSRAGPPSSRSGAAFLSAFAHQLGGKRPCDGSTQPQRLAVELVHRLSRRRITALDPRCEVGHDAFVGGKLPVGAELDEKSAEQMIVGFCQQHHWERTQTRAQ